MRIRSSPTVYAASHIIYSSPLLSHHSVIFQRAYVEKHSKCSIADACQVLGYPCWKKSLYEMEKFLGLIITLGFIVGQHYHILRMWNRLWGCAKSMPYT